VPLSGAIVGAPSGVQGFDANTPLSSATARQLRDAGFGFCIRYLTRDRGQLPHDLTPEEAVHILDAGLGLMAVQHVQPEGWHPSGALGATYGGNAVANAQQVGLPAGVNLWLDLEGVAAGTTPAIVMEFCNAWFDAVTAAGYESGVYVGANAILSGDDLYWRLKTRHYWKSGSNVPNIPHRGYQLVQRIVAGGDVQAGISIDRNVTSTDALGGAVQWLSRAPSPAAAAGPVVTAAPGFPARAVANAEEEWTFFGRQQDNLAGHTVRDGHKESEDPFFKRVGVFWSVGVLDNTLDGRDNVPWSAAFISWVMRTAGAGSRFVYSAQHSVYIFRAIRDLTNKKLEAGYWCYRLTEQRPVPGDIVCWSRQSGIDYDNQASGSYAGHCDLVIEVRPGEVDIIGGNVGDSVTKRTVALDANGFLRASISGGETLFGLMKCRIA
jgi:hypothetical protein